MKEKRETERGKNTSQRLFHSIFVSSSLPLLQMALVRNTNDTPDMCIYGSIMRLM